MKTIGIADMMADYIISHKGEEYKIDLWLDTFIHIWWEDNRLWLSYSSNSFWQGLEANEYTVKEIKDILLDRMWVYEDDIEEIKLD
jgi:hypothetical protein